MHLKGVVMKNISVAIDGPSASGKSTISKLLAKKLGFYHLSSGAIYRAIALYMIENKISLESYNESILDKIDVQIKFNKDGEQLVFLNNKEVTDLLNTEQISKVSTIFAGILSIREYAKQIQRYLASQFNIIIDGRDVTSVVLKDADYKFFLTASKKVRAKRRYEDYKQKGLKITYKEVYNSLAKRDDANEHREYGSLVKTKDSILINSSNLSIEQTIDKMYNYIKNQGK